VTPRRRRQRSPAAVGLLGLLLAVAAACSARDDVVIGSKKFTESVVLGEIATGLVAARGLDVGHRRELGGTRIVWNALVAGEIDAYPEYTGTLRQEIVPGAEAASDAGLAEALRRRGVAIVADLGFDNTYAIGMREATAARLGIRTLSDLARHPEVALGLTHEFLDRADGWSSLKRRYGLTNPSRGLDHDVAYRALESGAIGATDLYSTDAEIRYYGLRVLEDDLHHFPAYRAVLLARSDLATRVPEAAAALAALDGAITAERMIALNAAAKLDKQPERAVAADFLAARFQVHASGRDPSRAERILDRTREHLFLVALSLLAAVVVAVPLGIVVARRPRLGQVVLAAVGVLQTVPSLALLVLLIPLLGIGTVPALVAMFLYSLLPIVRNTATGIRDIALPLRESAEALGLPSWSRLVRIELPLASTSILAGIKTSAVVNVGVATLGALIGAGGYGQPILSGIRLDDLGQILEGAVPAAVMALLVQWAFEGIERLVVPRGLRLGMAASRRT
jgi:osmoprotectant transport system permease protein